MARTALVVATLVGGITLGTSSSVGAGEASLFTYAPMGGGPPGTVIAVSGTECFPSGGVESRVQVVLSTPGAGGTVVVSAIFTPVQELASEGFGTWSGTITVPASTAPGPYDIQAFCYLEGDVGGTAVGPPANLSFTYEPNPGPFTVTAGPAPVPAVPGAPGAATPAPAVGGAPTFTG